MLSASEFRNLVNTVGSAEAQALLGSANTNWQDNIYESATGSDHSVSALGSAWGVPMRLSFGYSDHEGILKRDNFTRTTGSLNLSPSFLDDHLKVELNARGMYTENQFASRGAIGAAVSYDPTQPVYDGSQYGGYHTWIDPSTGNKLNLATTNTKKLADSVEEALKSGGVDSAKEVCRNTKGPVASIYYQGLDRANEGVDAAEKAVVAYGGVQMGQLEKNVSWISLFIAIAPMLGFMGTVIGMIDAFDKIQAAGDMNPSLVAGGIKIALLTTVFGLIVAIILQIFYNYIIAKIDSIVNDMEDASISLMDLLIRHKK